MQGLTEVKEMKLKYEGELLRKRNVVGVGIGFKEVGGRATGRLSLVVMVREKIPVQELDAEDRIPEELEGIPTDVKAVGRIRALN